MPEQHDPAPRDEPAPPATAPTEPAGPAGIAACSPPPVHEGAGAEAAPVEGTGTGAAHGAEERAGATPGAHEQAPAPLPAPPDAAASGVDTAAPAAPAAAASPAPGVGAGPDLGPAACAARLAELFPALFGGDGPPKPVKLRIHADIQQRAPGIFTRKSLSVFLHRHTTGNAYLKALLAATHRHDLDGQPAGEVAEEHRAAAKEELERRRQVFIARRTAEQATRGERPHAHPRPGPTPHQAGPEQGPAQPAAASAETAGAGPGRPTPRRDRRPDAVRRDGPPGPGRPGPGGPQARGHGPGKQRPDRAHQPPRPDGRPQRRPDRHPAPGPAQGPQPGAPRPRADARPAPQRHWDRAPAELEPAGPEDSARRERAALLRTYEASSLSKANFCALKRLSEAELDALLNQARREREARGAAPSTPRA